MDTILASIRRILNEDESSPAESAPDRGAPATGGRDDVLVLRDSMMVQPEKPVQPEKIAPKMIAPEPIPPPPGVAAAPEPFSPPQSVASQPAAAPQSVAPQSAALPVPASADTTQLDPGLVAARTRAATEQSFNALHEALRREQQDVAPQRPASAPSILRAGGPSLEDLVRDELRSLLSNWLDVHLPGLVETLVRSEIAKLTRRG